MMGYGINFIKENVERALEYLDKEDVSFPRKCGFVDGVLHDIANYLDEYEKETIGETNVRWVRNDVINEFNSRFDRNPTKDEVEDIVDNYLELNDKGADSATEVGWDHIYSALDEWEADNPQETDEE